MIIPTVDAAILFPQSKPREGTGEHCPMSRGNFVTEARYKNAMTYPSACVRVASKAIDSATVYPESIVLRCVEILLPEYNTTNAMIHPLTCVRVASIPHDYIAD